MAPAKKAGFADQLHELLDSRAPKADADDDAAMPTLDAADEWGDDLYSEAAELMAGLGDVPSAGGKKKKKKLRMRGELGQAFTEGDYKGRVVDSAAAFGGDEAAAEEEPMQDAEGAAAAAADDDDNNDSDDDEEELAAERAQSRHGLKALKRKVRQEAAERDPEFQAARGFEYDVGSEVDVSSDEVEVVTKDGRVDEAAVSAKMDDIFAYLSDDSEVEGKGETYEDFVRKERLKMKGKKRKLKRNRDDFDSGSDQHDSDVEGDDEIARQIREIRAATEKSASTLVKGSEEDEQRAAAARAQFKLWSKLVACRIHLQQPMGLAGRMPSWYARADLLEEGSPAAAAAAEAAQGLGGVIEDLHSLREAMLRMNPSFRAKTGGVPQERRPPRKRARLDPSGDLDFYWRTCVASHAMVAARVDEALDHWHGRAIINSAQAAETGLKETTPATEQIEQALKRDRDRLTKKTQKNRAGRLPFGHPNSEDVTKNPRLMLAPQFLTNEDNFDDSDFYSWLLSDYIHNCSESKATESEKLLDAQRLAKDPGRLLIDKKRSKARKLSFEPHAKLVGFNVPVPQDIPPFVDQLYQTLFATA